MMLAKFRHRYPQGSLVSELIEIDRGFYLVKVSVQVEQIVLATGLAGASTIEAAEDSARQRAIAVVLNDDEPTVTDNTVNTTSNVVDRTSSTEPTATEVSSDEPEREIVNPKPKSESTTNQVQKTAEFEPEPISATTLEPKPSNSQSNLFPDTTPTEIIEEESNSVAVVDSTAIATANSTEMDFNEIKQKTDIEIKRLGWTKDDGREFLMSHYGKKSRLHLTDQQLLEFLEYLEQQPTPVR